MATVTGTDGNDFIHSDADSRTPPLGANDIRETTAQSDAIDAGAGDDTIYGLGGDDVVRHRIFADGADRIVLGKGSDVVEVSADAPVNVRLTFTSAEVGNGAADDADTLTNQDGGRAVRLQGEDDGGNLTGPLTRTDDEGMTFVGGNGVTFDVRDLVSGTARGDAFKVVQLGTSAGDDLPALLTTKSYYINGGGGNDSVAGGGRADFLVGGAGDDSLGGGDGRDSLLGGGGNDTLTGGAGNDTAIFNVTTDGADTIQLDDGKDVVTVAASAPTAVRLTFTSAEVGNGNGADSNTMANQDGGLAVRLQAEDGGDTLVGPVTRVDDEGTTFTAGAGVTFDVRDLVSGTQRGNLFTAVTLGTAAGDTLAADDTRVTYINAGMGDDAVRGGTQNDFLVGGMGADTLRGGAGDDSYVADATDTIRDAAGAGTDLVISAGDFSLFGRSELENLTLSGTADVDGTGNGLANAILGNVGANFLDGGKGADALTGGAGADSFVFSTRLGSENVDALADFVSATDTIVLDASVFRGLEAGELDADAFAIDPGLLDEDDRIVYTSATGTLSFDRDGSGTRFDAVAFATLGLGTTLEAADITIV